MNGRKARMLLAGLFAAGAAGLSGCCDYCYDDLVDPCYPQRYICQARGEVYAPLEAQAMNGLALEQTMWNYQFVTIPAAKEGDKPKVQLTPAGQAHLDYLARRRPCPIPEIFLQTAHDVTFNPEKPEAFTVDRAELDARRIKAVTDYLASARPDVPFKVVVHDPGPKYIHGNEAVGAVQHMHQTSQGAIPAESFGDGVPINGITGEGADPTGRGQISVAGAGATRLNIVNTPTGVAGTGNPAAGAAVPGGIPPGSAPQR